MSKPLPHAIIFAYAAPGFALAMPTLPVFVLLPAFYANDVGLGLAVTGVVLLLARLTDVITDPLIGLFSDRWPTPWGRRKPWIVVGGIIAAVALTALVLPPSDASAWYLAGTAVALYLGWTMVSVPYSAWGAELSYDYNERTRITSGREGLMLVGIVFAGSVPLITEVMFGAASPSPLVVLCFLTIIFGIIGVVLLVWLVEEPPRSTSLVKPGRAAVAALFADPVFVRLVAAWFINGLAVGLPAALFPLFLEHVLGVSDLQGGILIFIYFATGVMSLPLWIWLSGRYGKDRIWILAMVVACAAFLTVPVVGAGDWLIFAVICLITGAVLGADLALPPAMQADVVDYHTWRTGEHRAGLAFAVWSMATKAALALSVGAGFLILDISPFESALSFGAGEQVLWPLIALYALIPVAFKCLAIWVMRAYPLSPRRTWAIQSRLMRRSLPATP